MIVVFIFYEESLLKVIFIRLPSDTLGYFLKGAINFSEEMFVKDDLLTEKQFGAIERVSKEFFRRGAKPIPLR